MAGQHSNTQLRAITRISASQNHPMPTRLAVAGDILVVGGDDDHPLWLFDRRSGNAIGHLGRPGEGPGEFRSIGSIQAKRVGPNYSFWIYDGKVGRLTGFLVSNDREVVPAGSHINGIGSQASVYWANDTTLLGVPLLTPYRLVLLNGNGTVRKAFGDLPLVSNSVPVTVAQQILQPSAAIRPDGEFVAIGARYAGRIDIYRLPDGERFDARVPVPFTPDIRIADNGAMSVFQQDGLTTFGYVALAATDSRVYGLFSGRTRGTFPGRANYADQIHVFDWAGNFIEIISLATDVLQFAITDDDTMLYAIVWDPEPRIDEYRLSRESRSE